MHPKEISILDYTYSLPEERIARYPLANRDESKLLVYREGQIGQDIYRNITAYIPENSLLIFNNARVIEARIIFHKPSGGAIEIFCLEPMDESQNIAMAMQQKGRALWKCLIGGASKWKKGMILEKQIVFPDAQIIVRARFIEKKSDHFIIEMSWSPDSLHFAEVLHHIGSIPLPPYLRRKAEEDDKLRYQTIYACREGSVAAPTAGLHFTSGIMDAMKAKKIRTDWVTLHVGAGTFMPVKSNTLEAHVMHAECIEISRATIESILSSSKNPVIPVGTTSLRTLESLFWMGLKTLKDPLIDAAAMAVQQWEAYADGAENISPKRVLQSLLDWMATRQIDPLITSTRLMIAPGYKIRIASGIITNFHQPQSTLLLLVAAMIGDDWKKVYQYALENEFRFLSYGDGSILFPKKN